MAAGMQALHGLLPGRKAALALRWYCAGETLTPERFDRAGHTLAADERDGLADWLQHGLGTKVQHEVCAADGSIRMVLALRDGQSVETVAMPVGAVCISSQVGCAVGCRFCASGLYGLKRHLDVDEIVEQVVHARRRMRIDRVLFMGMGEPSHNLDAVLEAVRHIKQHAAIGPRRQTVSTVGSTKAFLRMAEAPVRPALAMSLHCADDARRAELMPRAHKEPVRELVAGADAYGRLSGTPVQFEWTLLAGVNDRDEDIEALCELLQGVRGLVNFILWNPVAGLPFEAPQRERADELVRRVKRAGILATLRISSGPDVGAACGQLRLRVTGT